MLILVIIANPTGISDMATGEEGVGECGGEWVKRVASIIIAIVHFECFCQLIHLKNSYQACHFNLQCIQVYCSVCDDVSER